MKKLLIFICSIIMCLCLCVTSYAEAPSLNAKAAILIDGATGKILYEKNAYMRWYPASTTKIMTSLLVLENGKMNDVVTLSHSGLNLEGLYRSRYLWEGMQLTVDQLLHALLIESDNGACNNLAEYVDGSQSKFIERMNARAKTLGCVDTHFTTTYGMTDEAHHVTAYDLYLIAKANMEYPLFREIVKTPKYRLYGNGYDMTITTVNQIVNPNSYNYDSRAIGIKTGYTRAAQCNLVACAEADGHRLYSVVLGCPRTDNGDLSYPDTHKLFNYGFKLLQQQ